MEPITDRETHRLADLLERAVRGGAWHGPALAESLIGVDAATAAAHPVPDGHSIWEIVLHAAAWSDIARRRMAGEAADRVPEEEDWPPVGPPPEGTSEEAWQAARKTLDEAHRRLHADLLALPEDCLENCVAGSDPTIRGLLLGLLQHHTYHAGQIVILKKGVAGAGEAAAVGVR
ncbi:MAG TPA: DinB family protein [Thermoanaerobaculia bacterium]|nr:DinB family protein [Thermoanaerobaculia bacterium]